MPEPRLYVGGTVFGRQSVFSWKMTDIGSLDPALFLPLSIWVLPDFLRPRLDKIASTALQGMCQPCPSALRVVPAAQEACKVVITQAEEGLPHHRPWLFLSPSCVTGAGWT